MALRDERGRAAIESVVYSPAMTGRRARWYFVVVTALAASAAFAADTTGTTPDLLAAASARDLWLAEVGPDGGYRLLHRTPRAADGALHVANESPGRPVALAAAGRTLYLVFEDGGCQSLRFAWVEQIGRPSYNARQLPPLPAGARLVDFAATDDGPIAVVNETVEGREQLRIVALRDGRWSDSSPGLSVSVESLRAVGLDGEHAVFVGELDGELFVAHHAETGWHMTRYGRIEQPIDKVVAVGGRVVIATIDEVEHHVSLVLLQPDGRSLDAGALSLVVSPKRRIVVVGQGDEAIAISRSVEGELFVSRRNLQQPPDALARQLTFTVSRWPGERVNRDMIMLGLMLVVTLIMIAVWRREPAGSSVELPDDMVPAPLTKRTLAALIDGVVPAAAAVIVFDLDSPVHLFERWPDVAGDWSTMGPGVLAVGLFVVMTTAGELLDRTTIGKRLMGCRVVDAKGQPAPRTAILVRGLMRVLELLLPPLLLFPLFSPANQRLGDLVARTAVVITAPAKEGADTD